MNKATKSLLAGLALSLSIGVFAIKGSKENAANPIVRDIADLRFEDRIQNDRYLRSFSGASFAFGRENICFNGSLPVGRLFEVKQAERPQVLEYNVNFDVTYLPRLQLGQINVSLLSSPYGEPVMAESVYAYPFRDNRGNTDIEFFMNGYSFFASEFMSGTDIKDDKADEIAKISASSAVSQSIMLELESPTVYLIEKDDIFVNSKNKVRERVETTMGRTTPNSSGIVYPIAKIITTFVSRPGSITEGKAHDLFPAPNVWKDGLASLLLYQFKMDLAFKNYKNNWRFPIPRWSPDEEQEGYINTQGKRNDGRINLEVGDDRYDYAWKKWQYGFFNLRHSGCPVFAVYNLLVDSAITNVDLPTLVLLFQLCNADLLFGGIGSLPVDLNSALAKTLSGLLMTTYSALVLAIMACLSLVAGVGVLLFFMGMATVVGAILKAYLESQKDLGAVLDVMRCSYFHSDFLYSSNTFERFVKDLKNRRQGIVSYWHVVDENLKPVISGNAHFVYIRNDVASQENKYFIYNCYGDGSIKSVDYGNEPDLVGATRIPEANAKTIGYYVL